MSLFVLLASIYCCGGNKMVLSILCYKKLQEMFLQCL
ncbi:hypothetical protein LINPERPRIM_LOCUS17381 [Linum perenne]